MSQTIALLIISMVSCILIIIGAALDSRIKHPGENRGTSILGFFFIALILFGIGSFINFISNWTGTWIILGFYLIYIIYGFISTLILWNKSKK